jgi:VanZ family protein
MSAIGDEQVQVSAASARRIEPAVMVAAWAAVAVWAAFIFSLSGDQFSDVHTAAWLSGIFGALRVPPDVVETGNLIVRKAAHFVEYAVLAILSWRAARLTWPRWRAGHLLILTIGIVLACGSLDELRQYVMTSARSGTWRDVAVDTAGGMTAAVYCLRRRRGA